MLGDFTAVFILAVLVEAIVEYFISAQDKHQPWLQYVAAVIGVAVCIAYKVDLLASLGVTSTYPFVGEVITGLIIGRGSNYLSDFMTRVRTPQSAVAKVDNVVVNQ